LKVAFDSVFKHVFGNIHPILVPEEGGLVKLLIFNGSAVFEDLLTVHYRTPMSGSGQLGQKAVFLTISLLMP